ncbi:MAG: DNA replication/repair protein RecF [Clostridiaceae bacterium]
MYIDTLKLKNFRNYKDLNIKLSKGVNVFTGDNAQGKTNILESVYYCSLGKSHRTNKDKELISWNEKDAYLNLQVIKKRLDKKIEVKIFKEGKKAININSIKLKKISELMGVLNVVIFSPEDLKIVKDSPSHRRRFLDIELSKLNGRYYHNLVQYNKTLDERNTLLKNFSSESNDIIDVYDIQLSKFGCEVIKERLKYLIKLNEEGIKIHNSITSGKESIYFKYISDVKDFSNIEEDILKNLRLNRKRDFFKKSTSTGPHRDDFLIEINGIDTRSFGSQGQQRTSILTIKFASLNIIKDEIGEYPILLLDDVLSELDTSRQKFILNSIFDVQTIITCTGVTEINKYLKDNFKLFIVKEGRIEEDFEK